MAIKAICWTLAILIFGIPVAAVIIYVVSETVEHFTP